MIQHKVDLRKYNFASASRAMSRLKKFIKDRNIKAVLIFQLPKRDKIKGHVGLKVESRCPYCGSKLKETLKGIICSGELLPDITYEIRQARLQYGEQAESIISRKALRFYDQYMTDGHLWCDYCRGNDECRWRKRWN